MTINEKRTEVLANYYNIILRCYQGREMNGWEFFYDSMVGTFGFCRDCNNDNDTVIYCTPYFEGVEGIAFNVSSANGEVNIDEILPLSNPTGNSKKDVAIYFQKINSKIKEYALL